MNKAEHAIPEYVMKSLENMRLQAFTSGWKDAARKFDPEGAAEWSGLDFRVSAAEAYNDAYGTDHFGDMIRRIAARESDDQEPAP